MFSQDEGKKGGYISNESDQVIGYVSEIFCSIQGEGLFAGERQVFLRTAGCSVACDYCDTPSSRSTVPECMVYGKETRLLPNPITSEVAVREVGDVIEYLGPIRTVSFTGGEPLEQSRFIASVARAFKGKGLTIYLETNGIEVDGLMKVLEYVDIVSMDIKLPSDVGCVYWAEHREFLRQLTQNIGNKMAFVKVVVGRRTHINEIETAVDLIFQVNRDVPLVFQPESATFFVRNRSGNERKALLQLVMDYQRLAMERLSDVRVIPQCHKIMGIR